MEAVRMIRSIVWVVVNCDPTVSKAVICFCTKNEKSGWNGDRSIKGYRVYVRPRRRFQHIAAEMFRGGILIINNKKPYLVTLRGGEQGTDSSVSIMCYRWISDVDQLISDCIEEYNLQIVKHSEQRFRIHNCFGTAQDRSMSHGGASHTRGGYGDDIQSLIGNRLLKWKMEELGQVASSHRGFSNLALSDNALSIKTRISKWKEAEDWHYKHGVPWKLGVLLHGEPGTGKTAFVKAAAYEFDLPIFAFDLATYKNEELKSDWQNMLSSVPCIALFEDIDAVFHQREPTREDMSLTFDCFLNCIDGVGVSEGIIIFITTNKLNFIDVALAGSDGKVTRPGRIDLVAEFGPLNVNGRRQLAERILAEFPDEWDSIVDSGKDETGAQFEQKCVAMAIELRNQRASSSSQ